MPVSVSIFGHLPDGRAVERAALRSASGLVAEVMSYGAALIDLRTPDRRGHFETIVLGFDTVGPYLAGTPYFGATVGRYANRIAGARFALDGVTYQLAANDGANHLHGGNVGFDKVLWTMRVRDDDAVVFTHLSPDGDEGYPGELAVEVVYRLAESALRINYRATTSKATPINLTHHSYFNLSGRALLEITAHELEIAADRYTPISPDLIPTGELRDVAGTPFDFRTAKAIGSHIEANDEQLRFAAGYDHNFVLSKSMAGELARAARLRDPASGRVMEVWTTEPGVQFYSGNFLDGSLAGPHGVFAKRTGLCLEPQHFPNSPNEPSFPSTILRSGDDYHSVTEFRFSVD